MQANCCVSNPNHWESALNCESNHCRYDLWAPEERTKITNMAFSQYTLSFELAARALAEHPEAEEDEGLQAAICREYGIFFDQMTEDERQHLYNLANEFMGE